MKLETLIFEADGKTEPYAEDQFESLMNERDIPFKKISVHSDPDEINDWLDAGQVSEEDFINGVPDYIINKTTLFVEVKGLRDGLRYHQLRWIREKNYNVKLAIVETKTGTFDFKNLESK